MSIGSATKFVLMGLVLAVAASCGGEDKPQRKGPKNYNEYTNKAKGGGAEASNPTAGNDDGAFGPTGGAMPTLKADDIMGGSVANAGSVKGQVKFGGTAKKPTKVDISKDPWCANSHEVFNEDLLVSDQGGLKNVVVYVSKGMNKFEFSTPSTPVVLDQHGCKYVPHVLCAMAGQELNVRNSDDTSHNYNFSSRVNPGVNKTQPKPTVDVVEVLKNPDLSGRFQCDIHGWMACPVRVFSHPYYALTDEQGNFEIKNLPAGSYEVSFLHERADVKCDPMTITVTAGQAAAVNATMGGK